MAQTSKKFNKKQIAGNVTVPPSINKYGDRLDAVHSSVVRTIDMPNGIVKTKAEPWLHTVICEAITTWNRMGVGADHEVIGAILVTFIWDTRKVVDVTTLNYNDVANMTKLTVPYALHDFALDKLKHANDNGQPLDGITMQQVYDKLAKYIELYRNVMSKLRQDIADANKQQYGKVLNEVKKAMGDLQNFKKRFMADKGSLDYRLHPDKYANKSEQDWQKAFDSQAEMITDSILQFHGNIEDVKRHADINHLVDEEQLVAIDKQVKQPDEKTALATLKF